MAIRGDAARLLSSGAFSRTDDAGFGLRQRSMRPKFSNVAEFSLGWPARADRDERGRRSAAGCVDKQNDASWSEIYASSPDIACITAALSAVAGIIASADMHAWQPIGRSNGSQF